MILIRLIFRVYFKKWQCHMSLSLIFADVPCRIKEKIMTLVVIFLEPLSLILGVHP